QMLLEEVEKRSRIRWDHVTAWPEQDAPVVAVGQADDIRGLVRGQKFELPTDFGKGPADGYQIAIGASKGRVLVIVAGNDARGVLFGVGRLLRELRMDRDRVTLPAGFHAKSAPQTPLRGHQLGYRATTNSYDGSTSA